MGNTRTGYPTPDHLLPTSKKMKEEWYKNTCNYYIDLALSYKDNTSLIREMNAFGGNIDKGDYHFILNPYNFREDRFQNLPGRLRNYDIIQPIWRRYLGEYSKSSNNFSAIAVNDEIENQYENGLIELVNETVNQMAANSLNAAGIDSGIPTKDTPNLSDKVKTYKSNWKQTRAELAQERLNFLNHETDDESVRLRCYSDWINYGEFYTYRDVIENDVYKEAVPIDEYYPIPNGNNIIEEHDAGVRVRKMTIPQLLEFFGNDLTRTQYSYLRDLSEQFGLGKTSIKGQMLYDVANMEAELKGSGVIDKTIDYSFCDTQGYMDVFHTVYKTQIETKILTYINPVGEELEVEVPVTYTLDKINGDIKSETIYRNRVWEQYRLGDEITGVYLKPKEIDVQRTDINNNNICKLPYNGRLRVFPGFPNHGIIGTLLPYQIFINILYLSRERAIAKNHGKIMVIPESFVTGGNGELSDNDRIYYMAADGKLYVDDTAPNFATAIQGLKSVDTSDSELILGLGALITETKAAAQEDVDMNRQRMGDTYASDGKYTTQQALIRSSLGSAIINDMFNKTFEKDYEADLDYSKVAWIEGKKGNYINSDRQVAFFEINGIEHAGTSYGIFVVNNSKEQEEMNSLKDLAFSAGQNGDFKIAAEAIGTDSSTKLKELIRNYDELVHTRQENATKAAQENEQQVAQIAASVEEAKLKSAENIAKYEGEIKLKIKELDILETELKIASDEERDSIKAEIENKKIEMQDFINSSQQDVSSAQKQLGLI